MSPFNKKLAAGATLAALGGITAVAIGQPGSTDTKKAAAAPVEVRTETIEKTVHVVRHEKPKHKHVRAPAAPAVAPRPASATPPPTPVAPPAAGSAPAYSPRPAVSVRVPASVPAHHPVTTRTSGSSGSGGGGEREDGGERSDRHESEGGDD